MRQIFHIRNVLTPYKSILFLVSNPKIKKNRTKQDKIGHFQKTLLKSVLYSV